MTKLKMFFNFLSFLDQEHTLDDTVEFRKQGSMKILRNLSLSLRIGP